jgi:hypothetical protein
MILRLLFGLVKGVIVGGLVGFVFAKIGIVAPGALFAYLGGAIAGAAVGLVAGKPIWAEGAKIEAGMKAIVGALLGAGLMWAVRKWLGAVAVPFNLGTLAAPNSSLGELSANGTIGGLALTSFAVVAGLLGGFYEADNTPGAAEPDATKATEKAADKAKPRIAASKVEADEFEEDEPVDPRKAKR